MHRLARHLVALRAGPPLAASLAWLVAGSALYGAALGAWHGPRLALYAAVKLPLVLLVTGAATLLFNAAAAAALGERLPPREAARRLAAALAVAAVLLGAMAPAVALLSLTVPPPSPAARLSHNLLYLFHTALVGGCGLAGAAALGDSLAAACRSPAAARRLLALWVGALALIGGEVAWALRPFVGNVHEPVAFLRRDLFDGNVYEHIAGDIVPYLLAAEAATEEP